MFGVFVVFWFSSCFGGGCPRSVVFRFFVVRLFRSSEIDKATDGTFCVLRRPAMKNELIAANGSVQALDVPQEVKDLSVLQHFSREFGGETTVA